MVLPIFATNMYQFLYSDYDIIKRSFTSQIAAVKPTRLLCEVILAAYYMLMIITPYALLGHGLNDIPMTNEIRMRI